MGYKAVGSAQDVLAALRKKGYLYENERQQARTYHLTPQARSVRIPLGGDGDPNTYIIPCLGQVPAGNPIEAVEDHVGALRMSIGLLPKPQPKAEELFAVRAKGLSMVNAGILDGDWLVVRFRNEAPRDSIVVARMGSDVTVKRLRQHKSDGWYLQPENPDFTPIFAKDEPFEVIGQVIALQRSF